MCMNPIYIKDRGTVACRSCNICRRNRVNDLVGRCIAEQQTATRAFAVTLTYRGDAPNCATLVYSDVQKFLKVLRKKYSVRYIVAGEYGTIKGRAHWHCVLFFYGDYPDINLEERFDWGPWPHGFSYFQEPDYSGFYYVLKYALKDQSSRSSSSHLAMSKKPPLGHDYFQARAVQHVEAGLAPQDFFYSWKDVTDRKGRIRKFFLKGKSRENFLERFLNEWQKKHNRPYPSSELLEEYEDQKVANDTEYQAWLFDWRADLLQRERIKRGQLLAASAGPSPIVTEVLHCVYEDEYGPVDVDIRVNEVGPVEVVWHFERGTEKWLENGGHRVKWVLDRSRVVRQSAVSARQLSNAGP